MTYDEDLATIKREATPEQMPIVLAIEQAIEEFASDQPDEIKIFIGVGLLRLFLHKSSIFGLTDPETSILFVDCLQSVKSILRKEEVLLN